MENRLNLNIPGIPEEAELPPGFQDYEYLKREILALTEIDLNGYKEKQMRRRINTLILRNGLDSYEAYIALLRRSPEKLNYFVEYITINVTEFFRTPEHWRNFADNIVPEIIARSGGHPKLWSAACSTGEEPYSLAMTFAEYIPLEDVHVLATDIDENVLRTAEQGFYTGQAVSPIPKVLLKEYFTTEGGKYRVKDRLRNCVTFRKLNLLADDYPTDCDLILCRNVLIYFTEESKQHVFKKCRDALNPAGILFTGNTEQLITPGQYGYVKETGYLYRKSDGTERKKYRWYGL